LSDGIVTGKGTSLLRNCITREGLLRLLPGQTGTDGFFVALIEKE
jgi:16S rRNA C967 or C1407 C5-methylase (RsmB/RsmF family)